MPRKFRIVLEGQAHHVIQRGNRRQQVFFTDDDRRFYLNLLKKYCAKYCVQIVAYCLMDNHVHLVAIPASKETFFRAFADTHKAYTARINGRYGWRGFLWQGRFISFVVHDSYFLRTLRYVETNPVRAKIVNAVEDYPWSSARAHILGQPDPLISPFALQDRIQDWKKFLMSNDGEDDLEIIRDMSRKKPL